MAKGKKIYYNLAALARGLRVHPAFYHYNLGRGAKDKIQFDNILQK